MRDAFSITTRLLKLNHPNTGSVCCRAHTHTRTNSTKYVCVTEMSKSLTINSMRCYCLVGVCHAQAHAIKQCGIKSQKQKSQSDPIVEFPFNEKPKK